MSRYLKQKLHEALFSLVGAADLDKRLTYAGTALVAVQDRDVPRECRERFAAIRLRLFATPLSSQTAYVPRQMPEEDAKALAQDILGLYTEVMGGL
jgi:hypothetical protein